MNNIRYLVSLCCLLMMVSARGGTVYTATDFFNTMSNCATAKDETLFSPNPHMQLMVASDPHGYCLLTVKYQSTQPATQPSSSERSSTVQQAAADTPYAMVEKSMAGTVSDTSKHDQAEVTQTSPAAYACPLSQSQVQSLTTPSAVIEGSKIMNNPTQSIDPATATLFAPIINCIKQQVPPSPPTSSPTPSSPTIPPGAVPMGTPLRLPSGQMVTPHLPADTQGSTSSAPPTTSAAPVPSNNVIDH